MTDRIEQAKRDLDAIRDETDCPWISGFFTCGVFTPQADRIEQCITDLVAENAKLRKVAEAAEKWREHLEFLTPDALHDSVYAVFSALDSLEEGDGE